jgi:two-component system, NtrC family, C4-dicarboxylate transport sensor histidine kinase DctB
MRKLLRRYGIAAVTAGMTLVAILISLTMTATINLLISGEVGTTGLLIAIIIPAVISPAFSYITLRLLVQLDQAEEQLRILAITDDLTGAFNRRYFFEVAEAQFARFLATGAPFGVALLDIDNFKKINDQYGHLAGDTALRVMSELCRSQCREGDTFARFGGEEFILLLRGADAVECYAAAERLRAALEETPILSEQQPIRLTVSVGVATAGGQVRTLSDLLNDADKAMYRAKRAGGNQVIAV